MLTTRSCCEWQEDDGGERLAVMDPAKGEEIGSVAVATCQDLDAAADAATRGFQHWRNVSAYERSAIMRRAAALLR